MEKLSVTGRKPAGSVHRDNVLVMILGLPDYASSIPFFEVFRGLILVLDIDSAANRKRW